MDVCFLPAWFYDADGRGGGVFFREQAIALQEVVDRIDLFYPALHLRYFGRRQFLKRTTAGLDEYIHQAPGLPKRSLLLRRYRREILRGFKRYLQARGGQLPDLIHAHSFWGAYAASLIKQELAIPYIYTEHLGKWAVSTPQFPAIYRQHLPAVIREAALVTAVSSILADNLAVFSPQAPVLVTPNLVDTSFFSPAPARGASRHEKEPRTLKLISIGDPWHTKGIDTILHALAALPTALRAKVQLTLVDEFPQRATLVSLIRQLGLQRQVHFSGRLERPVLRDLLREQDILLSASRRESFGVTMIEALACGVPVIATQTAGARDIIRPTLGLLVPVDQPAALAGAIVEMAGQLHRYPPTQLAAYATTHYGRASFQERWLQHYRTILKTPTC